MGDLSHKPQYGYTAAAKSEHVGPKFLRITDINKTAWIESGIGAVLRHGRWRP